MFELKTAGDKNITLLCEKANEIWHEHYASILSLEQIDYMVKKFQSEEAIKKQLKEGYEYYFLQDDDIVVGFIGIKAYSDYLYLSKFYILKEFRFKGYGRKAFEFLIKKSKEYGLKQIRLNVNKDNISSIKIYEKLGFVRYNSAVRDIGNGFVMDDYDYKYNIE